MVLQKAFVATARKRTRGRPDFADTWKWILPGGPGDPFINIEDSKGTATQPHQVYDYSSQITIGSVLDEIYWSVVRVAVGGDILNHALLEIITETGVQTLHPPDSPKGVYEDSDDGALEAALDLEKIAGNPGPGNAEWSSSVTDTESTDPDDFIVKYENFSILRFDTTRWPSFARDFVQTHLDDVNNNELSLGVGHFGRDGGGNHKPVLFNFYSEDFVDNPFWRPFLVFRFFRKPLFRDIANVIAPAFGPTAGGTSVVIVGNGFNNSAQGDMTVTFDGISATSVTHFLNDQFIIFCDTPAHAQGVVDVVVTNIDGGLSDTLVGGFKYTDQVFFGVRKEIIWGADSRFRITDKSDARFRIKLNTDNRYKTKFIRN